MAFALFAAALPAPAWACSQVPDVPVLLGQPAEDDVRVPTNVVLHYAVPAAMLRYEDPPDLVPGEFELRAETGEQAELSVTRPKPGLLELVPAEPLLPETVYTLTAHWKASNGDQAESALTFETSDGPVDAAPEPPDAVMRHYELERDHSASCGPRMTGSCISIEDDRAIIEYTFFDRFGNEQASHLLRGSHLTFDGMGPGECVDVRRFGSNGIRSQSLRLCADDAPRSDLTALRGDPSVSCGAAGLAWCDTTGQRGFEPGPEATLGMGAPPSCPLDPELGSTTSSAQSADPVLTDDAGVPPAALFAAPADGGCSAAPANGHAPSGLGWFAALASLGLVYARRHARRP